MAPPLSLEGALSAPEGTLECPREWYVTFNKYFGVLWKDSLTSWGTLWGHYEGHSEDTMPSEMIALWNYCPLPSDTMPSERIHWPPEGPSEDTMRDPLRTLCPLKWLPSALWHYALWKDSLTSWGTLWGHYELRDPLSSQGDSLSIWRGPLSSPKWPSELIVGPLSVWSLKCPPEISRGPVTAWGARQGLGALFGRLAPPLAKSWIRHCKQS